MVAVAKRQESHARMENEKLTEEGAIKNFFVCFIFFERHTTKVNARLDYSLILSDPIFDIGEFVVFVFTKANTICP